MHSTAPTAAGAGLRLAGEHGHAERAGALDQQRRARAHADDPQRLAATSTPSPVRRGGVAAAKRGVRAGQVAGARQHQRERVLGLGDQRGVRRVDHDDAAARGLGDVDAVRRPRRRCRPRASALPARQDGGGDRHARAGDEGVVAGDAAQPAPPRPTRGRPRPAGRPPPGGLDALGGEVAEDEHALLLAHLTPSREGGPVPRDRSNRASLPDVTARAAAVRRDCVQG